MYKLDLPIDLKQANGIEQRRCREEERKSRIFNSKIRQIGIDATALNHQIEEKKKREKLKNDEDLLFAAASIRADKIAVLFDSRQKEDLKELERVLNEFRNLHQRPEQRREYDLYDPHMLKKDKPARVCDDDPRCGVSSIQKFDGEDLNNKNRVEHQKSQMRNWLDNQIHEKNRILDANKQSEKIYDLKQIELDKRAVDLTNAEQDCRRAINIALSNYNKALNDERITKERLKLQHDDDDKRMHIINSLNSDLLTENPNQSISALGNQRIKPDAYKGMSNQQLEKIYEAQKQQIHDKKIKSEQEKELKEIYEKQIISQARSGLLLENEITRRKNTLDRLIAQENLKLSKTHHEIMDHMKKEVYTNQPTAAYFMQFNTCSR